MLAGFRTISPRLRMTALGLAAAAASSQRQTSKAEGEPKTEAPPARAPVKYIGVFLDEESAERVETEFGFKHDR